MKPTIDEKTCKWFSWHAKTSTETFNLCILWKTCEFKLDPNDGFISSEKECSLNNGRTESFPFPFLSQGNFGEKPFSEFLKAFPDLESDWQNLSCYF